MVEVNGPHNELVAGTFIKALFNYIEICIVIQLIITISQLAGTPIDQLLLNNRNKSHQSKFPVKITSEITG